MKKNYVTQSTRLITRIFTLSLITFLGVVSLNGQTINTWNQPTVDSDYFMNIQYSITPGTPAPDCNYDGTEQICVNFSTSPACASPLYTASRPNQQTNWTGTAQFAAGPNASNSYKINYYKGGFAVFVSCDQSAEVNTSASTLPLKAALINNISSNAAGQISIAWTVKTDIPEANYNLEIFIDGVKVHTYTNKSQESHTTGPYSTNETHDIEVRTVYFITAGNPIYTASAYSNDFFVNPPNGQLTGTVLTTTDDPVENVLITATLQNPGEISFGSQQPQSYTAMTEQDGSYVIGNIYYGLGGSDMADYLVEPTLLDHHFNPESIIKTLQAGTPANYQKTADFVDTTSYSIKGEVLDVNGCGVDSAFIVVTNDPIQNTFSKSDGSYILNVPQTGTYNVKASLNTLTLGTVNVIVDNNVQGQNFSYNETDSLSIYVGAGCFEYIGKADLAIRTKGGCLLQNVQTNLDGNALNLILPSREITVEVTNIYPPASEGLDVQDILSDIGAPILIDLDSTTQLDIFYRKPLSFQFSGIPAPPCPAVSTPVFDQAKSYYISIQVWESQGICPADTGYIVIQDNIASVGLQSTVLDTVPISNGFAIYNLIPGEPVLSAPFLKSITFTAFVDSQMVTQTIQGIVSGARQRTATFVTGAPVELPYLILRDPPGDASYSFFNENATTTYAQSYSALTGTDIKAWAKLAIASNALFVKVFGEIGGGVTVGASKNDITEYKTTLSQGLGIQTSSDQEIIGGDGDVVYGAAVNFVYGIVDERFFDIEGCKVQVDTGIMFSPDTFATDFFYTIYDIREDIIPELYGFASNQDTTEEARRKFRNEARKWEQVIQMNNDMKEDALKNPINNYTIASGVGPVQLSTTASSTKNRVIEFKEVLNGNIAASAGVSLFGAITVSAGVEVTIRSEWGSSTTNTIEETTTTGFVFDDVGDGFNDLVSFDYGVDDVYGTPVFGDPIGRTSCPHEPGTQFIDFPEIVALNPVKFATGAADELEFTLNLRNKSESNNTRTYVLDFIEQSNEFGVQVFSGANPFSGIIPFTIPAGGSVNTTVRIKKAQVSTQFSYEGLQFDLYPACEPDLKSSTFLSAYFENSCPYISMPAPVNNFTANSSNNNLIPITMDGYDLNPDVDLIKLVYSEIGDISWVNSNIQISGFNLQPPPHTYNWDVTGIPDGEYLVRWELYCGSSVNVSTRKCGILDRKPPSVFGKEEPKDDLYHPGDKISVMFDEKIDFASLLSNQNYFATNLTKGTSLPLNISLKGSSEIIINLGMSIDGLYNERFEIGLINVGDLYGNYRPDTVTWDFIVSEPDSDRDRVGDLSDRCPGGDDKKDTDMDGLPDDCDCLPTIPLNGRTLTKAAMDFDGDDDYIQMDSAYANVSNNFSFEFWAFPQELVAANVSQINIGVSPNNATQPYAIFPIQGENSYGSLHSTAGVAVGKNGIIVHEHSANFLTTPLVHYMPINGWTHIAISFVNKQASLYVNGQFVKQGLQSSFMNFVHPSSNIGGYPYIGTDETFYKGGIDEFRYWNYSRAQSEIQAQMHSELEANEVGLITYFDFNEGTPFGHNEDLLEIVDKSTNSFDGTLNGFIKSGTASNWITIPITSLDVPYDLCKNCVDTLNAAMDFDGVNDLISIPNNPLLIPSSSSAMTFELWVNPVDSTIGYSDILVASEGNFSILRESNGIFITTTAGVYANIDIPINDWTHLAFVFDMNIIRVYKNGVEVYINFVSYPLGNAGNPITLGGVPVNGENIFFDGRMDDVRFWDYARTADQVKNNLFIEMLGTEPGLAAYFDFNEGKPSANNSALNSIVDVTGNGNTGTLTNFNKKSGYSNWVASPLNFRIDIDEDGRPDVCDSCIPPLNLMLENQALNGMYMARDKITLGNGITFPANADVLFRTPLLELFDSVNAPAGVNVLVNPEPCEEE